MDDLNQISLDDDRLDPIVDLFDAAGNTAQEGFQRLVEYGAEILASFRDSKGKVPRGLKTQLTTQFEVKLLDKANLSKSYLSPASAFAMMIANEEMSPAFEFIWENFLDVGLGLTNSVTSGPLYTPGRLNAIWGRLAAKQNSICVVEADGLLIKKHPWHTLTVKQLQALNAGATKDPRVEDLIKAIFGNPENLEKQPGKVLKLVADLRKANETLESATLEGIATIIDEFVEEQRGNINVMLAEEEVASAAKRVMEAQQARLAKQQALGNERETAKSGVTVEANKKGDTTPSK